MILKLKIIKGKVCYVQEDDNILCLTILKGGIKNNGNVKRRSNDVRIKASQEHS